MRIQDVKITLGEPSAKKKKILFSIGEERNLWKRK